MRLARFTPSLGMTNIGCFTLALAVIIAGLTVAGCGKVREVGEAARIANDARDGKVTVTNQKGETATMETKPGKDGAQTVTVTGKDGTTTAQTGANAVKQEDVGVDFYPGATVEAGATTSTTGEKAGKFSSVTLTTTDGFDAVAKFYKDKYAKGNTVMEQPNTLMITMTEGEAAGKMIMVTSEDGKTQIMIHAGGSM